MFAATYTISGWWLLVFWAGCALGLMPSFMTWANDTADEKHTATISAVVMAAIWPVLLMIVGAGVVVISGIKALRAIFT